MQASRELARRPFGDSRVRVTPLGIGMAALGRPGYINLGHGEDYRDGRSREDMQRRAFAVLDAAWDGSIRYFDVVRSYGQGEAFLGDWLRRRQLCTAELAVASKWGYTYTADWRIQAARHEIKDHSLAMLRRQWQETKANLAGSFDQGAPSTLKRSLSAFASRSTPSVRRPVAADGPDDASTIPLGAPKW